MRRLALRRTTVLMLGPVGVSALTFSAGALAVKPQDTAPQAPRKPAPPSRSSPRAADAPAQGASSVTEVMVTAQRRRQRLIETPVPVTAIQSATLQRTGAVEFQDYLARVPGFQDISSREGETQLILRGITTGPQTNSTVSTYVDDTPFGSSSIFAAGGSLTPDFDPSDLQRVEVLRGSQGTLYGANSLGGLLKFVTTPPDTTGYHGRIEADGQTVDHGGLGDGLRGLINVPLITDTLAVRVSAFDRFDPGYINDLPADRHNLNGTRIEGGRGSVLWNATDRLTVRLTATVQNLRGSGAPNEDVNYTTLQLLYGSYQQRRSIAEVLNNKYRVYNGDVRYDLGFGNLISSTSYSTLRSSNNVDVTAALGAALGEALGFSNLGVNEPEPIRQSRLTEEVRLESKAGPRFDWQVGFYYDRERGDGTQAFDPFSTATGAAISLPQPLANVSLQSQYAEYTGYGDLTYHFTRKLDLQVGLRYSQNNQLYTQGQGGLLGGGIFSSLASTSQDSTTTFLVTPSYKIDPNNLLYVRIASGYRPGGPNALPPAELSVGVPATFQPDTLVNYEVGYKAALINRRLTLDLSAFYIDWKAVQVLTRSGLFLAEGNGGAAISKGLEATITYMPVRGITLSNNVAYTDAQLTANAPGVGGGGVICCPTFRAGAKTSISTTIGHRSADGMPMSAAACTSSAVVPVSLRSAAFLASNGQGYRLTRRLMYARGSFATATR